MNIKEYEELFGLYEPEDEECNYVVSYATKEECEFLCKKEREEAKRRRELEEAIEKEKQERWNNRKNVYTVREVYLVERNGKPVGWYYCKHDADWFAYEEEQEDFRAELDELYEDDEYDD